MKKTYVFAGISILLWSTLATVSKLLLDTMNSFHVLMFSSLFAALALLAVSIVRGKIKLLLKYRVKDYITITLTCLPGTFLYYVFLYLGTARMAASQAFIINYLWPIMSVIFACIILKEKMTLRKGLAIAISFLGVITVAGEGLFSFNKEAILGVGLCILAAISYGAFTALTKRWSYDEGLSLMISFFSSFVLSGVISIFIGEKIQVGIPQMLGFAYNGIAIMAIATVTWALALKGGNTAKVSNLAYITPFLSLVWTFFILHEPINPLSVLGLGIIILGIFIQLKGKKK
jgi:drug/metabolite transporter (DMT)-like permease